MAKTIVKRHVTRFAEMSPCLSGLYHLLIIRADFGHRAQRTARDFTNKSIYLITRLIYLTVITVITQQLRVKPGLCCSVRQQFVASANNVRKNACDSFSGNVALLIRIELRFTYLDYARTLDITPKNIPSRIKAYQSPPISSDD